MPIFFACFKCSMFMCNLYSNPFYIFPTVKNFPKTFSCYCLSLLHTLLLYNHQPTGVGLWLSTLKNEATLNFTTDMLGWSSLGTTLSVRCRFFRHRRLTPLPFTLNRLTKPKSLPQLLFKVYLQRTRREAGLLVSRTVFIRFTWSG